jgi:hypothetical protein
MKKIRNPFDESYEASELALGKWKVVNLQYHIHRAAIFC